MLATIKLNKTIMEKTNSKDLEALYYFLRGLGKLGSLAEFLGKYGAKLSYARDGEVFTLYDFDSPLSHITKVEIICGLGGGGFRVIAHTCQEYNIDSL